MGSGGCRYGSPVNQLLWLIILIFLSFFIASFCAGFYIILLPLTACISGLTPLCDFLHRGLQFPYFCAKCMLDGQPLSELSNACK